MAETADLPRIRGNVEKMLAQEAPEADIDAYLKEEGFTPQSFAAAMKGGSQRTGMQEAGRITQLGMDAVNKGIAGLPDLVLNTGQALSAAAGPSASDQSREMGARLGTEIPARPGIPQNPIRSAMEGIGAIQNIPPNDKGERLASDVIEGVAGSVMPQRAAAAATTRAAKPVMEFAKDILAGAGAGTGKFLGGEAADAVSAAPDNKPIYEFAGALLGGLSGAGMPTGGAAKAAYEKLQEYIPIGQRGREIATAKMISSATRAPASAIADKIVENAPPVGSSGLPETLGQRTRDPGIMSAEGSLARSEPATTGEFQQRRTEQNQKILADLDASRPEGVPALAGEAANNIINGVRNSIEGYVSRLSTQLGDRISQMAGGDKAALSREVRQAITDAELASSNAVRQLYRPLDENGILEFDGTALRKAVEGIRNQATRADRDILPTDVFGIIDDIVRDGKVELRELDGLTKRIGELSRAERGKPDGSLRRMGFLADLRQAADDALDNARLSGSPDGELGKRFEEARLAARVHKDTFARYEVGDIMRGGTGGEFSAIPPEKTISLFFKPGETGEVAMQRLATATADNPDTRRAVRDWVLRDVADAIGPNGTVNQNIIKRYVQDREEAFRAFPELRKELENTATLQETLSRELGRQTRDVGDLERGALRLVTGKNADEMGSALLKAPEADIRELMRYLPEEAQAGARRAFYDALTKNATGKISDLEGANFLKPGDLRQLVSENRARMNALGFSRDHVGALEKIAADAEKIQQTVSASRIPGGSDTAQNVAGILSMANTLGGSILFGSDMLARGLRMLPGINQGKMQMLLEKAFLEPEIALKLLRPPPQEPKAYAELVARVAGAVAPSAPSGKE